MLIDNNDKSCDGAYAVAICDMRDRGRTIRPSYDSHAKPTDEQCRCDLRVSNDPSQHSIESRRNRSLGCQWLALCIQVYDRLLLRSWKVIRIWQIFSGEGDILREEDGNRNHDQSL